MSGTLEDVASAADAIADDQRRIARDARRMQRQRDRGSTWAAILDSDASSRLLSRLRHSARRLGELSVRTAEMLARGLAGEGQSRRQIARRLDVSHQRISTILSARSRRGDAHSNLADR